MPPGSKGGAAHEALLPEEHRWGAPYLTQIALLFRRSLRTRRFQVYEARLAALWSELGVRQCGCAWQSALDIR